MSSVRIRPFLLVLTALLAAVGAVVLPAGAAGATTDYIQQAWAASGGASGPLGNPVSAETCTAVNTCSQVFDHGSYYLTPRTGAHYVLGGPLGSAWDASGGTGGTLGAPTGDPTCPGADHCAQSFLGAAMLWSSAHGAWAVPWTVPSGTTSLNWYTAWQYAPGLGADLGYPTDAIDCTLPGGACRQDFEHGTVYGQPQKGTVAPLPDGPLATAWTASGSAGGPLGYPTNLVGCSAGPPPQECAEEFEGGVVVTSAEQGVHVLPGTIGRRWMADAHTYGQTFSPMGPPTGDEVCAAGWCTQAFVSGVLVAVQDQSQPAVAVPGFFADTWRAAGGLAGPGRPLGDVFCGLPEQGCGQRFQSGSLYATQVLNSWPYYPHPPATSVTGAIQAVFAGQGWEAGVLSTPAGAMVCGLRGGGCGQNFRGGSVYWSPSTGGATISGGVLAVWSSLGRETGALGYPVTAMTCGLRDGGCGQHFQSGSVYWSPSTGSHAVSGAVQGTWASLGWEAGALGYPTGEMVCGLRGGGCGQNFQGGSVYWSPASGSHAVSGAVRGAWAAQGWESGPLGYPTSDMVCGLRGGGCGQQFQGGSVYWSPASGAHRVTGAIRSAWAAQGWENGRLGYPTGDPVPAGSGRYTQTFQGGRLTA